LFSFANKYDQRNGDGWQSSPPQSFFAQKGADAAPPTAVQQLSMEKGTMYIMLSDAGGLVLM